MAIQTVNNQIQQSTHLQKKWNSLPPVSKTHSLIHFLQQLMEFTFCKVRLFPFQIHVQIPGNNTICNKVNQKRTSSTSTKRRPSVTNLHYTIVTIPKPSLTEIPFHEHTSLTPTILDMDQLEQLHNT